MNFRFVLTCVAALAIGRGGATEADSAGVTRADAPARTFKVLAIGNSFSDSLLQHFPKVAADCGVRLSFGSLYIGGCSLKRHWENVGRDGDREFKPYLFERNACGAYSKSMINVCDALRAEDWDVVSIHQASPDSWRKETYEPYGGRLIGKIRELAPHAQIVVQETWSYTPWDKRLAEWGFDADTMYARLHEAYTEFAAAHGLRVIPFGAAVQSWRRRLPVRYAENSFGGDVVGGRNTKPEGRFRRGDDGRWTPVCDVFHLGNNGEYFQGLVWTRCLFGVNPDKMKYRPDFVTEDEARLMREIVRELKPVRAFMPGRKPAARIEWTKVVSDDGGRYIGWPTAMRTAKGEIIAVYSGDRDSHVCPHGKVRLVRSADGGETWSKPETVCNGPIDDRDAGLLELPNGDLVLFWFTSVAFHEKAYAAYRKDHPEYERIYQSLSPELKRANLGSWARRSSDGGRTWSEPVRVPVMTPHGGVLLRDGRILVVGRHCGQVDGALPEDPNRAPRTIRVAESSDGGRSFRTVAEIPRGMFKDHWSLCEPTVYESGDGMLTALIRYERPPEGVDAKTCPAYPRHMLRSVSRDGGKSWSAMEETDIDGFPPHVLRLRDGRLLCSYASRTPGREGIYAVLSVDDGKTWDVANELLLRRFDIADIGYPSTVENADGTLVTVYYGASAKGGPAALQATKWRLSPTRLVGVGVRGDAEALRGKSILLLGDSIRMGYAPIVREKLKDVADVYYPDENCRFSYYTLRGICDWTKLVPDPAKVDIVHWNNGLWDLGQRDGREPLTPIDVYAATIGRIAGEIRHYFPNAKIVFATTTPLNPAVKSQWHTRGEEEVMRYNAAALKKLQGRGVVINDLNAFVKRTGLSSEQKDIVHFNPNGCGRLADEVIRVLSALGSD